MTYREFVQSKLLRPEGAHLLNGVLGLCGEAGEVADLYKKYIFQSRPLVKAEIVEELGDVLFYLEVCCLALNVTYQEVEDANRAKLNTRYPDESRVEARGV